MFLSITLYFIFLFLIWWSFCGYAYLIYLLFLFKSKEQDIKIASYPSVAILVPCHNEEILVEQKVANLKALMYPKDKLEIYFLDGMSNDRTVDILSELIKDAPYIKIMQTNCKGKIKQINHFLPNIHSDIIVNTDADAMMQLDALEELVKEFIKDETVYVVGAFVYPENCIDLERHYWETQNWF